MVQQLTNFRTESHCRRHERYNPTADDPEGPRGDLVQNNLITGFNVGIQVVPTAVYNVFRDNVIAFITSAMELGNSTNQDIDNVGV